MIPVKSGPLSHGEHNSGDATQNATEDEDSESAPSPNLSKNFNLTFMFFALASNSLGNQFGR